jgi:hypothetical protein
VRIVGMLLLLLLLVVWLKLDRSHVGCGPAPQRKAAARRRNRRASTRRWML